ncbi:ABC transporter permease [Rhodococcus globerulus]|uniref:ABC transporter permease n=1 Tax=Rhodococcus globerulus TaxID=33008 RepID=A0ABU4BMG2_RHOGO|nr:ABC transporter permease [Rhodococcus globerulus]MDV6265380.1 ABC transporter permease [Rhodococcus globerulus]
MTMSLEKSTDGTGADRDDRWAALRSGRGLIGAGLVGAVVLAGLLAPWLAPFAPDEQIRGATLLGPSSDHWFGTDSVGRDVFSRTLYGIRIDLLVIFVGVPLGALIGSFLGLAASRAVWLDTVLQRSFDLILAFPTIVLAIALTMVIGPGIMTISVVIVLAEIPVFGRLMRTSVLTCASCRTSNPPEPWVRAKAGYCDATYCPTASNPSPFNLRWQCRSACSSKAR